MAAKHRLRTILLCAFLQMGVLFGMPMRPEEIRDLMQTMHQPKLAHCEPQRDLDDSSDPETDAAGG